MTEGRENGKMGAADETSTRTEHEPSNAPDSHTDVQRATFTQFTEPAPVMEGHSHNIALLMDVELNVRVEVGQAKRRIKDILELTPGSILELDKMAGEPIDVYVNNRLMAVGEVVVVDEKFGIRIMEILDPAERIKRLG